METQSILQGQELKRIDVRWEKRLGDILVEDRIIDNGTLYKALKIQKEEGGRLGWIMVSHNFITRIQLYQTLAKKFELSFVSSEIDAVLAEIDIELLEDIQPEEIINYQALPVSMKDSRLVLLTAYPNNNKTINHFKYKFGAAQVEQKVVTDKDISELVKRFFARSLHTKAIMGLYNRKPEESAFIRMNKPQIAIFWVIAAALALGLYYYTQETLIGLFALVQVFYLGSITYKFIISMAGTSHKFFEKEGKKVQENIKEYPVYTVLVPLFKEPQHVLKSIIGAIKNLDYPQNKLDIIFLFEKNDKQTIELAKSLKPPASWKFFYIPNGTPTTKPKACNYGLYMARGKYLVIYDAEDVPEPDQLKKAINAFNSSPGDYSTFQAFLNYYNRNENFLTRMFTLEYTYWFDYLLSGLYRFKLPIPLGGTSNHFKVDDLRKISGWDPFNVTEDADLGVRMAAEGKRVGVINSTTYEEANNDIRNWIRQRSRWIKGYMQTSLVYNRNPIKLIKTLGFARWASFQMLVTGTPFTFLVNPIMWITFLVWIIGKNWIVFPEVSYTITLMGTISLIGGNLLMILLNLLAAFSRKYYNLMPYALLNPIYWVFHSIASYKALWQLLFKPFYWEKTNHGITRLKLRSEK
ncbi:MAG: glycosyltransferase family 2 protein [Actinomycetota bacterium]